MASIKDLVGQRFGRLLVVRMGSSVLSGQQKKLAWHCQCDCGHMRIVTGDHLKNGYTKSCGCLAIEMARAKQPLATSKSRIALIKHGEALATHKSPEYQSWASMLNRCRDASYPHYGKRGISVCSRWLDYRNFIADMGRRPTPQHSIDRIDVNGNYEPGNCRWATRQQQSENRRKPELKKHISEAIKKHWILRKQREKAAAL